MKNRPPVIGTLLRALRLRCPVCGQSSIVERPFKVRRHCPSCDALFQREAGFFVGAILANVVVTEGFILGVYVACLLAGFQYQLILALLFAAALLFPVAFYHHSWSLWLAFDHIIERLPQNAGPPGRRL